MTLVRRNTIIAFYHLLRIFLFFSFVVVVVFFVLHFNSAHIHYLPAALYRLKIKNMIMNYSQEI